MLKTKSLFGQKYTYSTASKNKISKSSWLKRIALGVGLTVAAITSWDVALINTYSIKISNIAEYKVHNHNVLTEYESFKKQIDSVPYSDAQFNYDLKTLDYLYGHKDNVMYRKVINKYENGYGSNINLMIDNGFKYKDQNKNYERLLQATKGLPDGERKDLPVSVFNTMKRTIKIEDDPDMTGKLISSSLRLTNIYGALGAMSNANKKIYNNMNSYLKEKGYGENILFIDSNLAYNRSKLTSTKEGFNKYFHDVEFSANKANSEIEKYYKSGDKEKLRKLLQMARAFSYVMVERPINYINKNDLKFNLISSVLFDEIYDGSLMFDSARFIAKAKGEYTPENSVYYEEPFALYYY
ncbi:hypothetical protein [Serratia sp. Se-RSBMAAmG]|uniref:hypothetical protein n=1 Tax=Serratia sp. Se-RSBMAAmG TaxID=3043305 RepID=UPI0024AFA467|nr:hypothetical protein [Serratia sp. Se-RSBMAAmG]MDI6975977.1 hypothetical protein [Serratia sp. Se-RSBMAAmG]